MATNKDFLHRLFYNKKFVLAFSLVIAFLFWLVITVAENPDRDTTFSNIIISVTTEGTAAGDLGLDVISMSSDTASVKVSGPSYLLASLTANDISVSASIEDVTEAGMYNIDLSAAARVGGVNVVGVTPSKITAFFDYTDTKQYSVEVEAAGAVAVSGLVSDTPTVSNSSDATLAITGPRSELEKIAKVVAFADVNETLSSTQSFDASIRLYDVDGNELDKSIYSIPVEKIKITVPILKQKQVDVKVTFANKPDIYSTEDIRYSINISKVTILGPETAVEKIDSISLAPIDFDNISINSNKFDVAPVLPNGIKIADSIETFTVTVNTSGMSENVFEVTNFEFKNVGSGLKPTAISVKNVKICGPRSIVRNIKATDLVAVADLSGKTAGEYTVPVRIYAKTSNAIWQIGSYNVVVTIK